MKPSVATSYEQYLDMSPLSICLKAVQKLINYFSKVLILFNHLCLHILRCFFRSHKTGTFRTVLISTYLSRIFHSPLLIGVTMINGVHTRSLQPYSHFPFSSPDPLILLSTFTLQNKNVLLSQETSSFRMNFLSHFCDIFSVKFFISLFSGKRI